MSISVCSLATSAFICLSCSSLRLISAFKVSLRCSEINVPVDDLVIVPFDCLQVAVGLVFFGR